MGRSRKSARWLVVAVSVSALLALAASATAAPAAETPSSSSSFEKFLDEWGPAKASSSPAGESSLSAAQGSAVAATTLGQRAELGWKAPILVVLLAIAALLLGAAALPPRLVARGAIGIAVAERRVQLSLLGAAALVSGGIGVAAALAAS